MTPQAAFCAACGVRLESNALAALASQGERRRITFLFCDLVGSTPLAARLDPEEYSDLVGEYYHICSEAIGRYDGHIAQYLGDGVLAYFGFPVAFEDNAGRAVRSALELQRLVEDWNEHQSARYGETLSTRIGIHTGLAIIDDRGEVGRPEVHALGGAVNVAARVESVADADTTFISATTHQLLDTAGVTVADRGIFDLKGVPEPMRLAEVVGFSDVPAQPAASGFAHFVGRKAESHQIQTAWRDLANPDVANVVLISGEPGIGKSRLVQQTKLTIGQDVPWTQAACSHYERLSPFAVVRSLVNDVLGGAAMCDADRVARLQAQLREYEPDTADEQFQLIADLLGVPVGNRESAPLGLTAAETRSKLTRWLASFLVRSSGATGPGVLLIEDLQWADPSSLEVIELLVELLGTKPAPGVLLLLTARPDFEPLWSHAEWCMNVQLAGLSSTEIADLIRAELQGVVVDDDTVQSLIGRSDGVPLFAEELARGYSHGPDGVIPLSLNDLLLARLDRLADTRPLAQLASVLGREFLASTIKHVIGDDSHIDVDADLAQLRAEQIIRPAGGDPDRFEFEHALVREAAYDSLLRRSRRELHEQVAGVLSSRGMTSAEILAQHWSEADNSVRALDCWRDAAGQARERAAHVEAVAHLQHALTELEKLPESADRSHDEMEVVYELASSYQFTDGFGSPAAHSAMARARKLSEHLGDADDQINAINGLFTTTLSSGSIAASSSMANQLAVIAETTGDNGHRRTACLALAAIALNEAKFHDGLAFATEALTLKGGSVWMSEDYDDASSRLYGSLCAYNLADEEATFAMAEPLFTRAGKTGQDPTSDVISIAFALIVQQALRNFVAIEALADDLAKRSGDLGLVFFDTFADLFGGWAQCMQGGRGGVERIERGFANQLAAQQSLNAAHSLGLLAEGLLELGEHERGLHVAERAIVSSQQPREEWEAHRLRAKALGALGEDPQTVVDEFQRSLEIARVHDGLAGQLSVRLSMAQWMHGLNDGEAAVAALRPTLSDHLTPRFPYVRDIRILEKSITTNGELT